MDQLTVHLPAERMPQHWYNLQADLNRLPDPPLHPATRKPVGPEDLLPLFPMELIQQEVTAERFVGIPEEVLAVYSLWRPTPLVRARRLEEALETPARIYFKNESVSPPGSHKPNTAVPQAYYNKKEGVERLATETGAGQWGSALSFATNLFGLECTVYMVRVSYFQKPYRRSLMEVWNATVYPSPSDRTETGRRILAESPDSPGSLGIAISEALEDTVSHEGTKYSLGSVLNHVLLHQTIIGLEAREQLKLAGEKRVDVIIGCVGGGSNFAGLAFPFVADKIRGEEIRIVAVEPTASPTLSKGVYAYDFGDTAGMTPLLKMHTLGHDFVPPGIHAGGLRYHGMAPLVSLLYEEGIISVSAIPQLESFEAGVLFARTQGIVPAPETNHAIAQVIREARKCRESGEEKVILFNLSGHGHFDLKAYDEYFAKNLQNFEYPRENVEAAMRRLPRVS
jgi:tryptophan synthase beta chain